MAIALNVVSIDRTRRKLRVTFAATFTGSYVANGDVIDFTKATDTTFQGYRVPRLPPESIDPGGCAPGGFNCEGVLGATAANSKIKVWVAGSGAATPVEHSAGVYEAAILGDTNAQITAIWGRGSN